MKLGAFVLADAGTITFTLDRAFSALAHTPAYIANNVHSVWVKGRVRENR